MSPHWTRKACLSADTDTSVTGVNIGETSYIWSTEYHNSSLQCKGVADVPRRVCTFFSCIARRFYSYTRAGIEISGTVLLGIVMPAECAAPGYLGCPANSWHIQYGVAARQRVLTKSWYHPCETQPEQAKIEDIAPYWHCTGTDGRFYLSMTAWRESVVPLHPPVRFHGDKNLMGARAQ